MEYQFSIRKHKQLSVDNDGQLKKYIYMINKALKCSDEVYVFRAHNHLENKTELIEWCMFNCKNTVPKLKIFFKEYKRELEVMSSDKSDIYIIDLKANENRESFSSRFKIDYSSFRHNFSKKALENEMLVDNPEYDQYDFIFVKDNNIYMWTSMHELLIFINEGENE